MQTPKYKVIYNDFRKAILSSKLKGAEKLPDEISLARQYGCSRMTVKKGLDLLADEGLIFRKQGHGSFVLANPQRGSHILIEENVLKKFGAAVPGVTGKTLSLGIVPVFEPVASSLNLNVQDPVYKMEKVYYVDKQPAVIETTYIPPVVIPGLSAPVLEKNIYDYIEKDLGLKIASGKKSTYADVSSEQDQQLLGLGPCEPVLVVEQTAYLDNGTPFEFSATRYRFDMFRFNTYSIRR